MNRTVTWLLRVDGNMSGNDEGYMEKVKEIFKEYFKEQDLMILPAYRGFLAAGKARDLNHPLVMWLHKANIESLAKIAFSTAVERTLEALVSFIPFGTMGYLLLRDTLRVKMPRDVHVFVPDAHYVERGSVKILPSGEVVPGPVGEFFSLTRKTLTSVTKTVSTGVKGILSAAGITKKETDAKPRKDEANAQKELVIVIIRFPPKFLRRYLTEAADSLSDAAKTLLHSVPVPEFKITDLKAAENFLQYVKQLGFSVEKSAAFKPLYLPDMLGSSEESSK